MLVAALLVPAVETGFGHYLTEGPEGLGRPSFLSWLLQRSTGLVTISSATICKQSMIQFGVREPTTQTVCKFVNKAMTCE